MMIVKTPVITTETVKTTVTTNDNDTHTKTRDVRYVETLTHVQIKNTDNNHVDMTQTPIDMRHHQKRPTEGQNQTIQNTDKEKKNMTTTEDRTDVKTPRTDEHMQIVRTRTEDLTIITEQTQDDIHTDTTNMSSLV